MVGAVEEIPAVPTMAFSHEPCPFVFRRDVRRPAGSWDNLPRFRPTGFLPFCFLCWAGCVLRLMAAKPRGQPLKRYSLGKTCGGMLRPVPGYFFSLLLSAGAISTSIFTAATPSLVIPNSLAARFERSISRPLT